jgi:ABC-type Zn2+ transport system substrate-binding protein/surface adhesin
LKNKEEIIKYIKKILDKTKSDLETLREQLKKDKAFRELVKASLIRKKGRKFILGSEIDKEIDKMVDELATKEILDIAELNKLTGEDLRKFLVLLQEFGKELKLGEETKEEGKKEEKKEEKPSEFLTALRDSLYTALLMGITSIPLWIAFLGFFAPLWLIERVKKEAKIG